MTKLKVQFWRLENILIMKVLEQDESLRDKGYIYGNDDYIIESRVCPSIHNHTLYLRGVYHRRDNTMASYTYEDIKSAEHALNNFTALIKAFNNTTSLNLESTTIE